MNIHSKKHAVMTIAKIVSYFLPPLLLTTACMTQKTDLSAYYSTQGRKAVASIYRHVDYDAHGRPSFTANLKERPSRPGEQFVLVQSVDGMPVRSFDIAITSQLPDAARPFRVIYQWTGRGFKTGVAGAKAISDSIVSENRRNEKTGFPQRSASGFEAVGYTFIMTVGGFIVGLAASVPATVEELGHIAVSSYERVISYSEYKYDGRQRISRLKTYLPNDISHEIIRTVYFYHGDERTPFKTEITSIPENTVRTIP